MMTTSNGGLLEFEKFALDKMRENLMPSLAVAVVEDGKLAYSRAFGFRDTASSLPATPGTLYGVGSVTKSFTCLALCKLEEEGKLKLDEEVSKYLPGDFKPFKEGVQIRHLMSHSSGLPGLGYAEAFLGGLLGYGDDYLPISSTSDLITFMREARNWNDEEAKPGEKFYYLNEGFALLGEIISKASGVPYDEYLRKKIFEPLGMNRTFFKKSDVESFSDRATPYLTREKKKLVESVYPYGIYADGGIVSNVLDLSNYLRMYIERGSFLEGSSRIVGEKSIEQMESPHVKYPWSLFPDVSYGYGFFINPDFFGKKLVSHDGSVGVFTSSIAYLPETKTGIALLSNASGYPLGDLGMYALAALLGKDPQKELPFVAHETYLKKLEGRYDAYKGSYRAEVKASGDFLIFKILNKIEASELIFIPEEISEDRAIFYTSVRNRRYTLEFKKMRPDGIFELLFERYKFRKL